METTLTPLRLSMDLKATSCSRFLVKPENFQTRISLKGAFGLLPSSIKSLELAPVGDAAALCLVHVLPGGGVAFGLGVVCEPAQLGGTDSSTS